MRTNGIERRLPLRCLASALRYLRPGRGTLRAAWVLLGIPLLLALLGGVALAATLPDPEQGDQDWGVCHLTISSQNLSGPYALGVACSLPPGQEIEAGSYPAPYFWFAQAVGMCDQPTLGGDCLENVSLGSVWPENEQQGESERMDTTFPRWRRVHTGGFDPQYIILESGVLLKDSRCTYPELSFDEGAQNYTCRTLDSVTWEISSPYPPKYGDDYYEGTGAPPADEEPVLEVVTNGGTQEPTVFQVVRGGYPEDLTCIVGDGWTVANPDIYEGSTDTDGLWEWEHQFGGDGSFSVSCTWDDGYGPFDYEELHTVVNIGTGLNDIFEESCEALDIFCHVRKALIVVFVPTDLPGQINELQATATGAFPFSVLAVGVEAIGMLTGDLPSAVPPSISIPIMDHTFTVSAPSLSTEGSAEASAPCSWNGSEADYCGTYGDLSASEGSVWSLWGFRTPIRLTLTIGVYLAFVWWCVHTIFPHLGKNAPELEDLKGGLNP